MSVDFLGLPPEVRLRNLHEALHANEAYGWHLTPRDEGMWIGPGHPLLSICKTLREEAFPVFFANNTVRFEYFEQMEAALLLPQETAMLWPHVAVLTMEFNMTRRPWQLERRLAPITRIPRLRTLHLHVGRVDCRPKHRPNKSVQWLMGEIGLQLPAHERLPSVVVEGRAKYDRAGAHSEWRHVPFVKECELVDGLLWMTKEARVP